MNSRLLSNPMVGLLITISFGFGILSSCEQNDKPEASLKKTFQEDFFLGTALNAGQIMGEKPEEMNLVIKEFNSITPENQMKWMNIHPSLDVYNFDIADKFVELGEANNMQIIGHTLVWHSQLAPDVFKPEPIGDPALDTLLVDSATLMNRIKAHIETVAGRYKGRVDGWDVLNEALNEDGTLRESNFLKIVGEEYIEKAFEWAHEVDPDAELYYNDYNLVNAAKRDGAISLVKNLLDKGIQVDGIGVQAHWYLDGPTIDEIEECIIKYSDLGVKVMFTELDISVLPNPFNMRTADISARFKNTPEMNPYPETLPDSVQNKLAQRYKEIFQLFSKHQDKISRVTFWGLHDGISWKNDFPIRGRTDYVLLFDKNMQPKEAYWAVINAKEKKD